MAAAGPASRSPVPDDSVEPRPRTLQIVLWSAVTILATGLALHQSGSFQLGTNEDDSSYVVLAQSLVRAEAYGLMNEPDRPATARYPFGYPLLLAPVAWLFPDDPGAGRWLSLFATLGTGACLFWLWPWFSRTQSFWWGLAVSALYLLAPTTIGHTNQIMSEPSFTLWCVVLIVLAELAASGREFRGWTIVSGLVVVLSIFTRTIGLVVVMTCAGYLLWVRGRPGLKSVARAAAAALVVLFLIVAATPVARGDLIPVEYLDQIADPESYRRREVSATFASRLLTSAYTQATINLRRVALPLGGGDSERAMFARIGLPGLPIVLNVGIAALVAAGWGLWIARAGLSAGALVGLTYLLTIPIFPFPRARYLYPVQPQIFFGLVLAIGFVSRVLFSRWPQRSILAARWMPVVATVCLLAVSTYKDTNRDDTRNHVGDLTLRSEWIRTHTDPDAIVMTDQGQTDFLYGQRHTVPYHRRSDARNIWTYLRDRRVDYILLGPGLDWQSRYDPAPSRAMLRIRREIAPLIADGRVVQVHMSDDGAVRVLLVRRGEERR